MIKKDLFIINKLNKVFADLFIIHRTRLYLTNIFCRQIRNDDTTRVKTCSISWNILPTPFHTWMTWTRADSLPSYSSFRQFFRFCAARFASPSSSSYFSRLPYWSFPSSLLFRFFLSLVFLFRSFFIDTDTYFLLISIISSCLFLWRFTFYLPRFDGICVFFKIANT